MYTMSTLEQNFVTNVLYTVSGTDGTNTASVNGNIQFTNQVETDFIPYDQLTETQVLGWINAATNNQENLYANIDGQLNSMLIPPVSPQVQPLPWIA